MKTLKGNQRGADYVQRKPSGIIGNFGDKGSKSKNNAQIKEVGTRTDGNALNEVGCFRKNANAGS